MVGLWEYHAKQNKSDGKSQSHHFTQVWHIKLIANNKQQTKTSRHRQKYGGYQRERGLGRGSKG